MPLIVIPAAAPLVVLSFMLMVLPSQASSSEEAQSHDLAEKARRLHAQALVIDGHNDLPWELRNNYSSSFAIADLAKGLPKVQTDIPRLRKGGVGAQFWAAYVPAESAKGGLAAEHTLEQIDLIHRMVEQYPHTFVFARTADEIEQIHGQGKIACLIGIEGGHSLQNSLALLRIYHRLGVAYLTLTHADSLDWADSATDQPKAHGLSEFGREVIREMNRLGMMVDISHVSPATMHAVLDVSIAPVIASHSSAFAIAPHPRNVPDDVLHRIKTNNGVVMVNFFSGFILPEAVKLSTEAFKVRRELREKYSEETEYRKAFREWRAANPLPKGTVKHLVDHIDYIVKIAGIDHVGLGSDYDGVTVLPEGLEDVSGFPLITEELLKRGYSEEDIHKILGRNILRVMRSVAGVAEETQKQGKSLKP
jgi:membrane dipeptidase